MKVIIKRVALLIGLVIHLSEILAQSPITLHPENPHYFLFRGKPTILITSAEHYGMVLNMELNYNFYLDILQAYGFNQTRIFSGAFCEGNEYDTELGKTYQWEDMQNTLSPRPGKFLTPWQRSKEPGYIHGGSKFDLAAWEEAYFKRLRDFCAEAGKRSIVVEIVLFTANYTPKTWLNSPLNARNNINGVGDVAYNEFHLLKHTSLIEAQLRMVEKIVREANEFDNVYFEICNEPYWMKGVPRVEPSIKEQQFLPEIDEWQQVILQRIVQTEQQLPKKHMVAQNFANSYLKIANMNSAISVLNFHYAFPPLAVTDNYRLNRPVAFDETADGCNAPNRRKEAWAFLMAGGAVYSNLDWSFAIDDLTGTGRNPSGKRLSGKEVRDQLKVLLSTMQSFDFINARPIDSLHRHGIPKEINLHGLMIEGKDYLFYWLKSRKVEVSKWSSPFPAGTYEVRYIDPISGVPFKQTRVKHPGGHVNLDIPPFPDDLVVRITSVH